MLLADCKSPSAPLPQCSCMLVGNIRDRLLTWRTLLCLTCWCTESCSAAVKNFAPSGPGAKVSQICTGHKRSCEVLPCVLARHSHKGMQGGKPGNTAILFAFLSLLKWAYPDTQTDGGQSFQKKQPLPAVQIQKAVSEQQPRRHRGTNHLCKTSALCSSS